MKINQRGKYNLLGLLRRGMEAPVDEGHSKNTCLDPAPNAQVALNASHLKSENFDIYSLDEESLLWFLIFLSH